MTRPLARRIAVLAAALGTALLAACTNPTAPSEGGGIYVGSGTQMVGGGIYVGSATR
jgi:spermidine/putrescine-binding protein